MKTNRRGNFAVAVLSTLLLTPVAHAHFLWAEIGEAKSGEKTYEARLAFAEASGEITTGVPVEKINAARAWTPNTKSLALTTSGAMRRAVLQGERVFGASQTWGVLDKTAEGRSVFKLEYWSKAAATLDDASQNAGLGLELFAQRDENNRVLTTLKRGAQTVANASIYLHEPNSDKPRIIQTDAKGEARFEISEAGLFGLRANWNDETPGQLDGKAYKLTRHYTTLTFRAAPGGLVKTAAPASSQNVAANLKRVERGPHPSVDMQAYELLKSAHDRRQVMPPNFAGFTAKVTYKKDGKATNGTVTYRRQGKTEIAFAGLPQDEMRWVEDKLLNQIGHRRGGDFNDGDGRYALSLGKGAPNSFGTLIELNDGMKSSYRVKDRTVTEVTRTAGGTRFTISVLETQEADAGKYLANHFMVSYRDEKTGALQMIEGYRDTYAKVDGVWLPLARIVVTSGAVDPTAEPVVTMQSIRLSDIQLLPAERSANLTK
jgi:uncharacterized GH25 family protein